MRALHLPAVGAFLRYHDLPGAEPARVYLHGIALSSASFVHVAPHPALVGRRSLLVDFLGFGLSDGPDSFGYTLEEHADLVARLLDELSLGGCELVGHSMGGAIATLLAQRRPDLVSALVLAEANLVSGAGFFSGRIVERSEEEYVSRGYADDMAMFRGGAPSDSVLAAVLGMFEAAAPWAMHRSAVSLTREREPGYAEILLALDVRRTFLVGSRTLEAEERPPSGDDGAALAGTDVPVVPVPDAGHAMMFHNPEGFAHAVAAALP